MLTILELRKKLAVYPRRGVKIRIDRKTDKDPTIYSQFFYTALLINFVTEHIHNLKTSLLDRSIAQGSIFYEQLPTNSSVEQLVKRSNYRPGTFNRALDNRAFGGWSFISGRRARPCEN